MASQPVSFVNTINNAAAMTQSGGCAGSSATKTPRFIIQYANGPIFEPAGKNGLEDFETLIFFRGELTQNGAPAGVMPNTPAVVRSNFGKGRAMAFSPHPEKTAGLYALLNNSLPWLAGDRQ